MLLSYLSVSNQGVGLPCRGEACPVSVLAQDGLLGGWDEERQVAHFICQPLHQLSGNLETAIPDVHYFCL